VTHLLLELGADPTLVNDEGQVADPMDCGYWNTETFARVATAQATAACLEAGADVNARDENGMTPLLFATSDPGGSTPGAPASEDPAVVNVLLAAGADVNASDNRGNTALINAAVALVETTNGGMFDLAEDPGIVAALLAAGADVNAHSRTTALHQVAASEDLESVRMLLDAGADIHARDLADRTPLLVAAQYGGFRNLQVLEALVEAGADVSDPDGLGGTVLEYAVRSPADRVGDVVRRLLNLGADANAPGVLDVAARQGDNAELIAVLLAAGADVNAPSGYLRQSPLHAAASGGGPGVIATLVAGGAVVDAHDSRGMTPLLRAVEAKMPANVTALLDAGADVHARTRYGDTPLHVAAVWPRRSYFRREDPREPDTLMIIALAAAGADIDARNDRGETPLHIATRDRHQPVADRLLALGADPLAVDDLGRAPRPMICDWMRFDFVTAPWESIIGCLRAGADVHVRNQDGETPLHRWATYGKPADYPVARVIDAFVEAGADLDARDHSGRTPLYYSAERSADVATQEVASLIAAGAAANARDNRGSTPLHLAAGLGRRNKAAIVSLLAAAGADPDATDDGGRTALHIALRTDNPRVADRLIELGADTGAQDDSGHLADPTVCERWNTGSFFRLAPTRVVAACIEEGADVNARSEEDGSLAAGSTPLHFAAAWAPDHEVVGLLVRAGADVNARDEEHYTPLHAAAGSNQNPAVTAALLEAGANVNAQSEDVVGTPLHQAARWNRNPDVARLLVEAGADVNAWGMTYVSCCWTRYRQTPLHLAAQANPAAFLLLLDAGADPTAVDQFDWTPMDYAREEKALQELEVVKRSGR